MDIIKSTKSPIQSFKHLGIELDANLQYKVKEKVGKFQQGDTIKV